ncbi:MAG: hypothetical protein QOD00_3279 [Blastocatellia bacterium]|jgi:probable HAF family extracellular repeat protein|nr:hypothetical protein [Blastocatellia bacterium]
MKVNSYNINLRLALMFGLIITLIIFGLMKMNSASAQSTIAPATPILNGDAGAVPAAGDQIAPQIVKGANGYLAVWTDYRTAFRTGAIYEGQGLGTMADIYAARLDAAGNLLDTTPIIISQAPYNQSVPHVAWNGQNWLVTWTTERESDRYYYDVLAVRVSPDGRVLDNPPIVLDQATTSINYFPVHSVSSDGTNYAVVWQGLDSAAGIFTLKGARIAPDGTVLDAGGKTLRHDSFNSYPTSAHLVFAGDEYMLAWVESTPQGDVVCQRLTPALNPLGAPFQVNTFTGSDPHSVGLATDGNNFIVAWSDDRYTFEPIFAERVSHSGQPLDANNIQITGNLIFLQKPFDVTFDGANYVFGYSRQNANFTNYDIYATRVNTSGVVLNPAGIAVRSTAAEQITPAIASLGGGSAQFVWVDFDYSATSTQDIYSATLNASGAVGPGAAISLGAPRQSKPHMAVGNGSFLSVYRSERSGETRILAQRLDQNGAELDAEPLVVAASTTTSLNNPSIAWNGSVFLVVWEDSTVPHGQIYGRRVSVQGTFLDTAPVALMNGVTPDVAALGDTFLIVGTDAPSDPHFRAVYAVRVDGASGAVIDNPRLTVGNNFDLLPRVAALGNRWLVMWQAQPTHDNPNSSILNAYVNTDGTVTAGGLVSDTPVPNVTPHLAVTNNGAQALVVWSRGGTTIYGKRIQANGTLSASFAIASSTRQRFNPAVAWDGAQFVVVWTDQRNDPFPAQPRGDIYAARVDANGNLLDLGGIVVSNANAPEEYPFVASAGDGKSLFAYAAFVDRAPYASHRITLRAFPFDRNFAIYANPSGQTIAPGGTTTFTVNVAPINGFSGTVALRVNGLPAGATASFSPPEMSGGAGSSALTITTNSGVAQNTYQLTITGASGAQQSTEQVNLVVTNNPATASYAVTDLGTLATGSTSEARSINDNGQIVGFSTYAVGSTNTHAFLYNNGGALQDLGTLGGTQSRAYGINNAGVVVGQAKDAGDYDRAFRYSGDALQNLGTFDPSGLQSYAYSINEAGQIAGSSEHQARSGPMAFLLTGNQMQNLGTFGGYYSYAFAVNASGHAAGYASSGSYLRAYYYDGTTKHDLGSFLGGTNSDSYAWAMNDADVVVGGSSYDPGWPSRYLPFRSVAGGPLQYLGSFGGNDGEARGINNAGQIVGSSNNAGQQPRAFIYDGGQMSDLNALIPASSGWILTNAYDINNNGQIVGKGTINGQTHAYLLTLSTAPESITPTSQSYTTTGGTGVVHVASPGGNAWSAASNANWITLQSGTNGTGNGVIIYNVTPTSTPRTSTLTITNQTFTVIQEASTNSVPTATISGQIKTQSGAAISGSALTLSGSQAAATTTDANGNYTFPGLPTGGDYTVTPSQTDYVFTPQASE